MFELPDYVYAEIKTLISQNTPLPILIPQSCKMYLALENDDTVLAFSGIEIDGVIYKIGVKK